MRKPTFGAFLRDTVLTVALLILALLMAGIPIGCETQPDQQTKAQVQTIVNKSAVAVADQKAADKLAAIKGTDSPVTHPIAAANQSVKALRPWLILLSIIGTVGWILAFGFGAEIPLLTKFSTSFRWIAVLSLTALFTLPFIPISFFVLAAVFVGLVIYELVKTRSIPATEAAIVADVKTVMGEGAAVTSSVTKAVTTSVTGSVTGGK